MCECVKDMRKSWQTRLKIQIREEAGRRKRNAPKCKQIELCVLRIFQQSYGTVVYAKQRDNKDHNNRTAAFRLIYYFVHVHKCNGNKTTSSQLKAKLLLHAQGHNMHGHTHHVHGA